VIFGATAELLKTCKKQWKYFVTWTIFFKSVFLTNKGKTESWNISKNVTFCNFWCHCGDAQKLQHHATIFVILEILTKVL
jgi:hypothetical protein